MLYLRLNYGSLFYDEVSHLLFLIWFQMSCQHLWAKSQKFYAVELLFIICKSILVYAYFLDRQHCPAGAQTVIDTISDQW